ncbi:MAG: hypothetical protein R3B97_18015 [Dehalococcoidia bacterium]
MLLLYALLLAVAAVATYEAIEKPARVLVRKLTLSVVAKPGGEPSVVDAATAGTRQA